MANISIFFANEAQWDTDLLEREAIDKGYRPDVVVGIGETYYKLSVYTVLRLAQDFETEQDSCGYFTPDINLVLVPEASKQQIIDTIRKLHQRENYFVRLKPAEPNMGVKVKGLLNHDE